MSDFDQGVVNATAEQTFEQIAEKLQDLMEKKFSSGWNRLSSEAQPFS